ALPAQLGLEGDVCFLGPRPTSEVASLYRGAIALIFPSLLEGFGLPILEAMACGTPVITSNRSSMAEVAGDAAVLVDPEDVESIAAAISQLMEHPSEREEWRRRGPADPGHLCRGAGGMSLLSAPPTADEALAGAPLKRGAGGRSRTARRPCPALPGGGTPLKPGMRSMSLLFALSRRSQRARHRLSRRQQVA